MWGREGTWMGHDFVFLSGSAPGAAAPPPVRHRSFHGSGGTLFGIYIVNLLFTIVTLGIYYFWGKTRIRNYVHNQMEFDGDRYAYHGTGRELFVGFLKVAVIFAALFGGRVLAETVWGFVGQIVFSIILYVFFLIVTPIVIVRSRGYRLSRTSWRGIRFSFRGAARHFVRVFVPGTLLTLVTLGLYYPFFQNNIRRFLVNHSYYGATAFRYDGKGRDLFGPFLLVLVLTVLTVGVVSVAVGLMLPRLFLSGDVGGLWFILLLAAVFSVLLVVYWFWFSAYLQRYFFGHTSFATARFRSTVTGGRLLRLHLGNLLRLIFTLGLATPWVMVRNIRFAFGQVALEGPLDLAAIRQEAQAVSAAGEALGDFLGVDVYNIDLGL